MGTSKSRYGAFPSRLRGGIRFQFGAVVCQLVCLVHRRDVIIGERDFCLSLLIGAFLARRQLSQALKITGFINGAGTDEQTT